MQPDFAKNYTMYHKRRPPSIVIPPRTLDPNQNYYQNILSYQSRIKDIRGLHSENKDCEALGGMNEEINSAESDIADQKTSSSPLEEDSPLSVESLWVNRKSFLMSP